jgi:hypothetical protein
LGVSNPHYKNAVYYESFHITSELDGFFGAILATGSGYEIFKLER